jgi:hypothetical protein
MLNQLARPLLTLLLVGSALVCSAKTGSKSATQIVLDPSTFPKISRPLLQDTADQVARVLDEMIPGEYPGGRSPKILCFVANGKWGDKPRALVGKPWKIEPVDASKYAMRIAVTPEVLPGAWQRLVFQVSHELAHLKMDAQVDNNVLESFAVAVSLEALHRLGYDSFRESNERYYTQSIPPEIMAALNRGEWDNVGLYLRYEWRHEQAETEWDQATHFIGAMALRKVGFGWERLSDIGAYAQCGSEKPNGRAKYCPLSPAAFNDFPEQVRKLFSRDPMRSVLVRISDTQQTDSLSFKDHRRWVSLRWLRKMDSYIPPGYLPVD